MFIDRRLFFKMFSMGVASSFAMPDVNSASPSVERLETLQNAQDIFTSKRLSADVVVAGGGLAGVCASVAAARNGASVILVQDRSRLGGNSSSEIRMHALGATQKGWRETGIIEELKLTDAATNLQRSFEMWDLNLYDKVVSEKNITLLLDTAVMGASVTNNAIKACKAASPLLEEYYTIEAPYFLDCTGDATLAAVAGAEYMWGREGKTVFGESLAPDHSDRKTMGNSIMFFAKKHDHPIPFKAPEWANVYNKKDFLHRKINSYEYGYWWVELGGEGDTIRDNRRLRHELLATVLGIWDYIKNSGEHPDSKNWALDWVGMIPGKRENRRIVGEHILVQKELEQSVLFPDRCSYGGWAIDDHAPEGINKTDQAPNISIAFQAPYSIPLRSLYSKNIQNLFMAGRNISASHVALSSTRVMATCAAQGQAVGTAAAFCVKHNCLPRDIPADTNLLQEYQQILLKDDQSLLGIKNEDPKDFARLSQVRASSFAQGGRPELVIDGWNRDIKDGQVHQWRVDMTKGEQWLELAWEKRVNIGSVQLTFDSGSHRNLALSGNDSYYKTQVRGAQPETVADYKILADINGKMMELVQVQNNFLRLRKHSFAPIKTDRIRIVIGKTQGDLVGRIFEVRCYA